MNASVMQGLRPLARRLKCTAFSGFHKFLFRTALHKALLRRMPVVRVAFGERNNYGINPLYTTIDIANADVCLNFNDCPVLPFTDSSVGVAFTSHALEHLTEEKVRLFLKEVLRVLRPGGKLLVELPDCEYLYRQWVAGERELFDQFLFDEEICKQVGHPEISVRRDIAFANIVSCMNGKNAMGEYQHIPVYFESGEFEIKIAALRMDDFFDWLIGLQSEDEKLSGGHVSAWYPTTFRDLLAETGFASTGEPEGVDPFLFRGGARQAISFRLMAVK